MRITTALASVAAATALIVGTMTPADAATQTRSDSTDDVVSIFGGPTEADQDVRDAADIRTLRGVHGDGKLTFRTTVADLARPTGGTSGDVVVTVRFVTAGGRDYRSTLQISTSSPKSVTLVDNETNQPIGCDGLEGRAIAARDQFVLVVPRSCVRNPREVRFGAVVLFFGSTGEASGEAIDDARRDGTTGEEIRLGTRALENN